MPPLPVNILKMLFFFVLHLHQSGIAFGLRVPNAMDLGLVPWELLWHVLSDSSSKLWQPMQLRLIEPGVRVKLWRPTEQSRVD